MNTLIGLIKGNIKSFFESRIKTFVDSIVEEKLDHELQVRSQLQEFYHATESEKASYWEQKFDPKEFCERFKKSGIEIEEIEIDIGDFGQWMGKYPSIVDTYKDYGDVKIEKVLEHYLTLKYLDVKQEDILIDIAAAGSNLAKVLRKKGMKAYRQDLTYPDGINGYDIGGDAGNMPLSEAFADVLTLHCAFECFQGDADVKFAREAGRILRGGGRVGIIPLYIDTITFVKISPWCDKRNIQIGQDTKFLWRDDTYKEPFSRHYSPETFSSRIISKMSEFDIKILYFTNLKELSENVYPGSRIYCYFMFKGQKR